MMKAQRGDLVVLVEEASVAYVHGLTERSERVTIAVVAGVDKTGLVSAVVLEPGGERVKVRATPKAQARWSKTLLVPRDRVDVARCHRAAMTRTFADVEAATVFVKGYLLPEPLRLPL